MAEPWQCPACKTWLRPDVTEHRCDPDGGVTADVAAPLPTQPPATVSVTGSPHAYWRTATSATGTTQVHVHLDGKEIFREVQRQARAHQARNGGSGWLRAV